MKGLVLAGGAGTRLRPLTRVVSKQLLPVFDKPLVYYPVGTLMLAGIRDICVISSPEALQRYRDLLGDGADLGLAFTYVEQARPGGLPQAFILAADFIGSDSVALALGDNVFVGQDLTALTGAAALKAGGATIFACQVDDPRSFAVVEFDGNGRPCGLEEKPTHPKSRYAVPGLYFYPNDVVRRARALAPSARGELEITDINKEYLQEKRLDVRVIGPRVRWLDAGTPERLVDASVAVRDAQASGQLVGSIEEIAFRLGHISATQLRTLGARSAHSAYGDRLLAIANGRGPAGVSGGGSSS